MFIDIGVLRTESILYIVWRTHDFLFLNYRHNRSRKLHFQMIERTKIAANSIDLLEAKNHDLSILEYQDTADDDNIVSIDIYK